MNKATHDVALLKSCFQGHTESFEVLVGRYQSLVCAITFGATGSIELSEELAQETFLLAWKNLGQLKDLAKFKSWLCRIAQNVIHNWRRSDQRDVVIQAAPLEAVDSVSTAYPAPEEIAIQQEQQIVVNQALERIPDHYRLPLILFYREDKSIREVASLIGLNENATRQRISRARGLLKNQVAAMVETTLAKSKPGKAFTAGVVASLAGMSIKGATATAAGWVTTSFSALTVKIAGIAAGIVVIAGVTLLVQKHKDSSPGPVPPLNPIAIATVSESNVPVAVAPNNPAQVNNPPAMTTLAVEDAVPLTPKTADTNTAPALTPTNKPYQFEPTGVLSGLITDADSGEPIVDAKVRISNNYIFDTRTDANGFYSFDKMAQAGQYDIAIDCPRYIGIPWGLSNPTTPTPVIHLSQGSHAIKHFQLNRACTVQLRVVDVNGMAIPNDRVIATSPADDQKRIVAYFGGTRQTDDQGQLLLGGFAPSQNEYLITVWHEGPWYKRDVKGQTINFPSYDYAPGKARVVLTDPNVVIQQTLVLEKGMDVEGYVEYADGVPATDIDIIAEPSWWHTNAVNYHQPVRADGTFTLHHIIPGNYALIGYFPDQGLYPTLTKASLPLNQEEPLFLQLSQKSPQSLVSISGAVILQGKVHPNYIDIDAYSPRFGHASCRLSKNAYGQVETSFNLNRLEPGTYQLTFSGEKIEQVILKDIKAPCDDLEVTLTTQEDPILKGFVLDEKTQKPITSYRARVIKLQTLRGPGYVQENQWGYVENKEGEFSLNTVGPGIYQVQIIAPGYAPAWSSELNTDLAEDAIISLNQGGAIHGTVIDEQGKPVTHAQVIPLSQVGQASALIQNRLVSEEGACLSLDGVFTLNHLPAGKATLKITHPDFAPYIVKDVEVTEGESRDIGEILLTTGGTLEGHVYDNRGGIQAKEVLYVQDAEGYSGSTEQEAGRIATIVTDVNGFLRGINRSFTPILGMGLKHARYH